MSFKPSKYQTAVFDFISKGKGNALVSAVAGSGKTTTMVEALKLIPKGESAAFLAFNKDIAEELKSSGPAGVMASTLNSLGMSAWTRRVGRIKVDINKTRDILNELSDGIPKDVLDSIYQSVRKLVSLAKAEGIVPDGMDLKGLVDDTEESWSDLADHYGVSFGGRVGDTDERTAELEAIDKKTAISLARDTLRKSIEMGDQLIDFDDQLYLPVIFNAAMTQYDWVFVDEAQDVSAIQRALVSKALRRGGRLVAVGDERQAIYAFRGADSESIPNIRAQFKTTDLPLSVSYRCPKLVVAEAKLIVPHIEHHDAAPNGIVRTEGDYNEKTDFRLGDLILCRSNAPIIRLAYNLIRRRMAVKVLGRDIGAGLTSLIKRLKPRDIEDLLAKLERWHTRECKKRTEKDREADLSDLDDKRDVIAIFAEESGATSISALVASIEKLFSSITESSKKAISSQAVNLATIHKSKGLESERVFFLDRELLPSKYAKQDHQIQQENNLIYVAVTRSKHELIYINSPSKG